MRKFIKSVYFRARMLSVDLVVYHDQRHQVTLIESVLPTFLSARHPEKNFRSYVVARKALRGGE